MLKLEGIEIRRSGFPVLESIDLELATGAFYAVLGRNGAGKTSLVETIAGLIKPTAGTIWFDDEDITALPAHKKAAKGIALVPEGRKLFPAMTVAETLAIGAHREKWLWGGPPKATLDAIWELFPDLVGLRKRRVGALSGGQQQMVAIGRALASSPRLLVLDEPSFGLSPMMVEATIQQLGTLHTQGVSVLLVEQNIDVALDICDEGAVLSDRRIVGRGEIKNLIETSMFRTAMFGGHQEGAGVV